MKNMNDFKMKKIEKDIDNGGKLVLAGISGIVIFWIISGLLSLAFTCGIIYVALHFIMKLW